MANIAVDGLAGVYEGKFASKILLEPMFTSDDIMGNYRIYPNVKYKQNLMLAPKLQGITAVNDACGANACTPTGFTIAPKVITTTNTSVKQEQCWTEFKDDVIVESYRAGVDMADLSGTELADSIINRTRDGIKHDLVRNMWAGDSGAAVADCSYKSMGDGLWEALSVGTAIDSGTNLREVTSSITGTAPLTTVGAAIPPADADLLLQTVFDTAPAELQQVPASQKRMFVTPNIYNAYYGSLTTIANTGAVDYGHSEAQSGVNYERLRYRGVELVCMYEWDEALSALTGVDLPPLFQTAAAAASTQGCIYGAKDNFFIGTDVSAPENELKMFYDEVTEKMYIRSAFTMGFQYGWDSLVNGGMLV
jgi:hypothetical protein